MKFMLLIHQGDTPTPRSPEEWGRLTEAEFRVRPTTYDAERRLLERRLYDPS